MKKMRLTSLTGALLAVLMLFSACGSTSSSSSTATPQASSNMASSAGATGSVDITGAEVTMILKNLTNPFFITVKEGAEAAAQELGIDLTVLAPLQADNNEEQSQMAEQAIVNQTDLLIMCPADSNGIIPAMQKVQEAGIPIVALNTKIGDDTIAETLVGIENYEAGYETVKAMAEAMGGSGKIMIIEGVTGAQTSIDRVSGAMAALEEYPDIELVAQQSGEYNRAKAMDVVQNLLQTYPDINAIYCCNDEMALGTVEALEQAGKTDVIVGGSDGNDDARQAIREGKMSFTCYTQPYQQGYQAVVAAAELLQGNTVDEFIKVPILIISIDNVDD